jgi:hypothetical protein
MVVLRDGNMTAETDHAVSGYWWEGGVPLSMKSQSTNYRKNTI